MVSCKPNWGAALSARCFSFLASLTSLLFSSISFLALLYIMSRGGFRGGAPRGGGAVVFFCYIRTDEYSLKTVIARGGWRGSGPTQNRDMGPPDTVLGIDFHSHQGKSNLKCIMHQL